MEGFLATLGMALDTAGEITSTQSIAPGITSLYPNPFNENCHIRIVTRITEKVSLVIYEQQGQRRIPVNYAKRVVGRKVYGAQNAYLPFKINPSGVIPVIFASSVLIFPLPMIRSTIKITPIVWKLGLALILPGPMLKWGTIVPPKKCSTKWCNTAMRVKGQVLRRC